MPPNNYKNIVKGTTIFGGVQVFNILINVIRGKVIAILLGPAGMGVYAILNSTINTIAQFSGLGLNLSAVKDISKAYNDNDTYRLSQTVGIFRKLVFLTGIFGAILTIILAPLLSKFSFGDSKYTIGFVILAVMLFFSTITNGETALLQGTRKLRELAISSVAGTLSGLLFGLPLFYFFRTDGIAPAMGIFAITTYIVNRHFSRKISLHPVHTSAKHLVQDGGQMIIFGITLMIATLIGTLVIYLINIYIRSYGSIADVGLYQAATSITNQYVGLIFSAMAVDYFPRLAGIADDNIRVRQNVNEQTEIVMLLIAPLIIALLLTAPILIRILLTKEFGTIIPLLRWLGLGLFFKAAAFPMGYISFAKGDKKTFFLLEGIWGNGLNLVCSILGYKYGGLTGLGISYTCSTALYFISLIIITKYRYNYQTEISTSKLLFQSFCILLTSFVLFTYITSPIAYILGSLILGLSLYQSYIELDKRLCIRDLILKRFQKKS